MVVAQQNNGAQAWTMQFAGVTPSHDVALTSTAIGSSATNAGFDTYTTAAALYVFGVSTNTPDPLAFDHWNINAINAWTTSLRNGSTNAAEQKFISDIQTAETSDQSLYPGSPAWAQGTVNSTIANDITNVYNSNDAGAPTPCPSVCTGTPSP